MSIETAFTPVASTAGGALIGVSAVLLLIGAGRIAGISSIVKRLISPQADSAPFEAAAFLAGLILAPLAWQLAGGSIVQSVTDNLPLAAVAGVLVGFGAVLGSGCTSGHGVCGLSRFSTRSLVAVITFMAAAAVTVYIARHVVGVQ